MTTVTKVRRRADGSLEHYQEAPETPAQLAARTARMLQNVQPTDPMEGRAVVGLVLTPKAPDGSGGVVEKIIRVGAKPKQEYALPIAYMERCVSADHLNRMVLQDAPASEDELAHLKDEAKKLQAILDDPATGAVDRMRTGYRLTAITVRIEQLTVALHPAPQAGKAPTAGA